MSLFHKSYKLAKIFDTKYSNHYLSNLIMSFYDKEIHELPGYDKDYLILSKIIDRPNDIQNIKHFVNNHFKKYILKAICVILIKNNFLKVDHKEIEEQISLFLDSFKTNIKSIVKTDGLKSMDENKYFSLLEYIDGYILGHRLKSNMN